MMLRPLMKSCLVCFFLLLALITHAQMNFKGKVTDSAGKAIVSVSVRLQYTEKNTASVYCLTDKDGFFSMQYEGKIENLQFIVSSFNYEKQVRNTKPGQQYYEFILLPETTMLKEIKIQKDAIVQRNDTLIFDVKSFATKADRSIGDVIARLPGVEMENGVIKYQGKPISRYYTQGKNLLGKQYIMANESISLEDISNIYILKNHQPIKVLQGEEDSNIPALNIEFKKNALNKPNSRIAASTILGSDELSWNASVFTIIIGEKKQMTADYQANNTGNIVKDGLQINSILDKGILSAQSVIMTPIKKDYYYLFNNTNALKSKLLLPLSKKQDLKIEMFYMNDNISKASGSKTTYFFPDKPSIEVLEPHQNAENKNLLRFDASFIKNLEKDYFTNVISLSGIWTAVRDHIYSAPAIRQKLGNNNFKLENQLQWIHAKGKHRYNLDSNIIYSERPEYLSVEPSNLLGVDSANLLQQVNTKTLLFRNTAKFTQKTKIGTISLAPNVQVDAKKLDSQLIEESETGLQQTENVAANNFTRLKLNGGVDTNYEFKTAGERLKIYFQIPLIFSYIKAEDKSLGIQEEQNRVLLNFDANLKYSLSDQFWINSGYSIIKGFTTSPDNGYGAMMINYRTLNVNRTAQYVNFNNKNKRCSIDLEYVNINKFISAKIGFFYNATENNQLLSQNIENDGTVNAIINRQNQMYAKGMSLSLNKYFSQSKINIGTNLSYSIVNFDKMLDNNLINTENQTGNFSGYIKSNPLKWLEINYNGGIILSKTNEFADLKKQTGTSILKQNLTLVATLNKWTLKYELESSYVKINKNNYNLSDATLLYKFSKKIDFNLTGRNLANIQNFTFADYSNNSLILSTYELRSINILAGVNVIL